MFSSFFGFTNFGGTPDPRIPPPGKSPYIGVLHDLHNYIRVLFRKLQHSGLHVYIHIVDVRALLSK